MGSDLADRHETSQVTKGAHVDMTQGPLAGKILAFAVPVAITAILQQMYNTADVATVGRFMGEQAMAAVGTNGPIIGLLIALFQGISIGANVSIATALGARDDERVHRVVHTAILVALLGGLIFALVSEALAIPVLNALSVPADVLGMAEAYLRVYLAGLPVLFLYDFEAAILRGQGDTWGPLRALVVSSLLNVCLNLLFVVGLGGGAGSVAAATIVSSGVAAAILFARLVRTETPVRVTPRDLRIDRDSLARIIRIGLPAGLQGAMFSLANIVVQGAINSLGATVMAASSAGFNLEVWSYYFINAFGQACTTFIGQNNGARKPERCRRTLRLCLAEGATATAVTITLILTFGHQLLAAFNPDPAVVRVGYERLCFIFSAYGFSLVAEVLSGCMRGFGQSLPPAMLTMATIVGIRLVWVFTVFRASPTFATLMSVYPLSLGANALALVILFVVIHRHLGGGHVWATKAAKRQAA